MAKKTVVEKTNVETADAVEEQTTLYDNFVPMARMRSTRTGSEHARWSPNRGIFYIGAGLIKALGWGAEDGVSVAVSKENGVFRLEEGGDYKFHVTKKPMTSRRLCCKAVLNEMEIDPASIPDCPDCQVKDGSLFIAPLVDAHAEPNVS